MPAFSCIQCLGASTANRCMSSQFSIFCDNFVWQKRQEAGLRANDFAMNEANYPLIGVLSPVDSTDLCNVVQSSSNHNFPNANWYL